MTDDQSYTIARVYDYTVAFAASAFFAAVIGLVLIGGMETIAAGAM